MSALVKVGVGIAVAALLLWLLYWATYRANLEQQRDANHTSQQWQDAQIAAERNRAADYDRITNEGQKAQIKATFCAVYADITNPPADLVAAHAHIC